MRNSIHCLRTCTIKLARLTQGYSTAEFVSLFKVFFINPTTIMNKPDVFSRYRPPLPGVKAWLEIMTDEQTF